MGGYCLSLVCGLGAILVRGDTLPDAWLQTIDARIAYRGPDGHGILRVRALDTDGRPITVGFVHRRLAIIDPADGAQPMTWPSGSPDPEVVLVTNGCIYNHRELRRELEAAGCEFTTDHSDTEVLIHGWRTWGRALPDHLEGMYAFAIWDRAQPASLFTARDWFGEKPLYQTEFDIDGRAVTVAASDARAVCDVRHAAGAATAPDLDWLGQFLHRGYAVEATPWRDVRAVPITRPPTPEARDAITVDDVDTLLGNAVASRLEADVPLGCFLSGGIDSSLIAHYAIKARGALDTFTVAMPDPRYDESDVAAQVAAHLGTTHHTLPVHADPAEDLKQLIGRIGMPFADSSILPTHWVARAAREHVAVALSGDGGDELFFGYERYAYVGTIGRMRGLLRCLPASLGARAHPRSRRHRIGRAIGVAHEWSHVGYEAIGALFSTAQRASLCPDLPWKPPRPPAAPDPGVALRTADLHTYLPYDLLAKVDLATMACPLEARCPFLDRALVHRILATDPNVLRAGGRKAFLRRVARRHLPAAIVDRPKRGFAIPVGAWFADPNHPLGRLLRDRLAAPDPFGSWPIDAAQARALLQAHEAGADHGQRLFALLTIAI